MAGSCLFFKFSQILLRPSLPALGSANSSLRRVPPHLNYLNGRMIVETEFRGINSSTEYQVTVQLAEREWSAAQGCSVWGEDGEGGRREGKGGT